MSTRPIRVAVRGLIVQENALLLVNAYPAGQSDLWCLPGGGAESGTDLPGNLAREIGEETGLEVAVGALALVSEFHDPMTGFHQVDLSFRCHVTSGVLDPGWVDPEEVVHERRFFARDALAEIRLKPEVLREMDWLEGPTRYAPIEVKAP